MLEKKRIAFVTDYNAINIKCLTKESYCTGLEKTTFCYRIENELQMIHDRMEKIGVKNMSAYIRKMAIDGYYIHIDYNNL